ncbi:MAG: hypothetical protein KDB53_21920 [Planctomycetes bacterium]|nr:hypothetical protein [Planctomycetota bacterium]
MNWTLFRSIHLLIALAISGGFVAWLVLLGAEPGSREGSDVNYNLWSGWVAFAFMVVACLYSARKYMHKLGYSPEFKRRVSPVALERADSRLNDVRRKIARGFLKTETEVTEQTRRIVAEEGVGRVLRVSVERDDSGDMVVRALPPEPFGRMLGWLHGHVYYGLFSGVLVWLHGAGSLESPLGLAMNLLTYLVILTGIVGIFLFAIGPTWLTRNEKTDMNFEDVFVLEASLGEKITELEAKFEGEKVILGHLQTAARARGRSEGIIQRELEQALATEAGAKNQDLLRDVMVLIGQRSRMRRSLGRLTRIRFWMNIWRAIHVPASILLMAIVVGHIISVWIY